MPGSSFEQFRELVLRDLSVQAQLQAAENFTDFLALMLRLGRQHQFDFTEDEVRQAWQAAQRAWLERWI